jgi:hypothetical protein
VDASKHLPVSSIALNLTSESLVIQPGSNRSGAMSFRHLGLSTESVQTLKQDLLTVRVKIPSGESSGTVRSNIASEINVCVVCQSGKL